MTTVTSIITSIITSVQDVRGSPPGCDLAAARGAVPAAGGGFHQRHRPRIHEGQWGFYLSNMLIVDIF